MGAGGSSQVLPAEKYSQFHSNNDRLKSKPNGNTPQNSSHQTTNMNKDSAASSSIHEPTTRESFSTIAPPISVKDNNNNNNPSQFPIIRKKSLQQQDYDLYSHLLLRQFQSMDRLNTEKMRKSYADYLYRYWITGEKLFETILPQPLQPQPETVTPLSESNPDSPNITMSKNSKHCHHNNMSSSNPSAVTTDILPSLPNIQNNIYVRKQLDSILTELLQLKVPALEMYGAVFADYQVILNDEEAQNKVLLLTQLKIRDAASSGTGGASVHAHAGSNWNGTTRAIVPTDEKDEKNLPNPLITMDQLKDLIFLSLWPIFQEDKAKQPSSPRLLTSEASSFFKRSTLLGRTLNAGASSPNSQKDQPVSMTNASTNADSLPESNKKRRDSKSEEEDLQTLQQQQQQQQQQFSPAITSITRGSPSIRSDLLLSKQQGTPSIRSDLLLSKQLSIAMAPMASAKRNLPNVDIALSKVDLGRHQSILQLYDLVCNYLQSINDVTSMIKYSKWWQATAFLTFLENVTIPLAIYSIEKDGTYFPLILVNKTWEAMTGHNRQDVIGLETRFLLRSISSTNESSQFDKVQYAMKEGLGIKLGMNLQRKDGNIFYNFLQMIPVYDTKNQYRFMVTKLFDVHKATSTMKELKYSEEILYLIVLALRYL